MTGFDHSSMCVLVRVPYFRFVCVLCPVHAVGQVHVSARYRDIPIAIAIHFRVIVSLVFRWLAIAARRAIDDYTSALLQRPNTLRRTRSPSPTRRLILLRTSSSQRHTIMVPEILYTFF